MIREERMRRWDTTEKGLRRKETRKHQQEREKKREEEGKGMAKEKEQERAKKEPSTRKISETRDAEEEKK